MAQATAPILDSTKAVNSALQGNVCFRGVNSTDQRNTF
jgi:hypothetical protein